MLEYDDFEKYKETSDVGMLFNLICKIYRQRHFWFEKKNKCRYCDGSYPFWQSVRRIDCIMHLNESRMMEKAFNGKIVNNCKCDIFCF